MRTHILRSSIWLAPVAAASLWLSAGSAHADVANDPPSVTITSPADGDMLEGDPATFDVVLDVFNGDVGIERIDLTLDGQEVGSNTMPPWDFSGIEAGVGMHELVATAIERGSGDPYPSPTVTFAVLGGAADSSGSAGGTAGSGGSAGTTTGSATSGATDSGPGDDGGSSGGCAVDERRGLSGAAILLGLLLIGIGRRRRSS